MLKALLSEASDSTQPCSTSPQGLCSFNDRKGNPRHRGGGDLVPSLPACQGLHSPGLPLAVLFMDEPGLSH